MNDLKYKKYVLIVNMGNYIVDSGGTNKVVFSQQKILNKEGFSVICIYPYKMIEEKVYWGIILDGRFSGIINSELLLKKIEDYSKEKVYLQQIIIHHLIKVNLVELKKLIQKLRVSVWLYIHDFYMICPQRYLMIHSEGRQCLSNYVGDADCKTCNYYLLSKQRAEEIREFIVADKLIDMVIAPSEMALQQWLKAFKEYKGLKKVIEHQKMIGNYNGNSELIDDKRAIKIGFVGNAIEAKGWNYWYDAIQKLYCLNKNYEFHQFGAGAPNLNYVKNHNIIFQNNLNAMIEALRVEEIDCVVLWSIVKETYSYTYYESWSANAYILTNCFSGNIASQVLENKNGMVVDSVEDLYNILEDEKRLRQNINKYRRNKKPVPMVLEENDLFIQYISYSEHNYCFGCMKNSMITRVRICFEKIIVYNSFMYQILKKILKRFVR